MSSLAHYFSPPWKNSTNDPSLDFVRYDLGTCKNDDICIAHCTNSSDNDTGNSPQIFESYESLFTCIMYPNISRNLDQGLYSASDVQYLTDNGFYVNDSLLSQTIVSTVSNCLLDYCSDTPSCTSQTTPCTRANLALDNSTLSAQGFVDCYASLCSPAVINPDIAGIGTVVAYLSQIALASLAYFFLRIIVVSRSSLRKRALRTGHGVVSPVQLRAIRHRWRKHELAIIGTLVEFHKAQCFFAISIQIAALKFRSSTDDGILSLQISNIGHGPVAFVLWILFYYEKESWYLWILSLFSWLLSSIVLWKGVVLKPLVPQVAQSTASRSCGLAVSPSAACTVIVDTVVERNNRLTVLLPLNLLLCWPSCTFCLLYIVPGKFSTLKKYLRDSLRRHRDEDTTVLWEFLCVLPWATMIAVPCYGWSEYIIYGYIDTSTFGFGQIVAITVWLPALAELLWLEMNGVIKGSEYRLAKPLKVVSGDDEEGSSTEAQDNCDNDENGRALLDLPTRLGNELAAPANRSSMDNQDANSPGSATGLTVQH